MAEQTFEVGWRRGRTLRIPESPERLIIGFWQYLAIPGLGALLAWIVWHRIDAHRLDVRLGRRAETGVVVLGLVAAVLAVALLGLRYATWHTHVLDLGSYDQKIWVASVQDDFGSILVQTYRGGERLSPCGTTRYWGICHFQPLYVVYALVYGLWASPLLLLWSQALLVVSGLIPCYLLARDRLGRLPGALAGVVYLAHPAVQFNALLDFRPDHVAIPFLLWAYWLVERGRAWLALAAAAVPALVKGSLILAFVGFAIYVLIRRRLVLAGTLATVAGLLTFVAVEFVLLAGPGRSEGTFMIGRYFSGGSELLAPTLVARKLAYLVALFGPLGFLSWREPLALLPALPSIGISLLSRDVTHVSIQSQYSASVVAPALAGLVAALAWLETRHRDGALRALAALVVLSLVFSLAQGPTPLGINFWSEHWGRQWHYGHYIPDRQAALDEAARLIPSDPEAVVVSQNDINAARLAHRHYYFTFPVGLERADYILLDTGRRPFVYWIVPRDRAPYDRVVRQLRESAEYRLAFERDGVLLFARVGPRQPGPPDNERLPVRPEGLPK